MPTLSGGLVSWFRLKACPKCQGDLASDDGDWLCLQCGTYYYTGLYSATGLPKAKRPSSGPDDESRSNGELASQAEQGQTDQSSRSLPDHPPRRQEKALVWGWGDTPSMASQALRVAVATADFIPSVDLAMRRQ